MARRLITSRGAAARFEGIPELQERFAAIITRLTAEQAKKVYMQGAMVLRDGMRALAPVKTGRLRDAIFAAYGDKKKQDVLVGVNYRKAPHAHLVEYGTRYAAPQPYFRPAITQKRNEVVGIVADGLWHIIIENE